MAWIARSSMVLVARRVSVLARLRGPVIDARGRIATDALVAPEVALAVGEAVPAPLELLDGLHGETGLEREGPAVLHALAGGLGRALVQDARRVARLLGVQAEVDQVD